VTIRLDGALAEVEVLSSCLVSTFLEIYNTAGTIEPTMLPPPIAG
jgi:hypothetical protein